MEFIIYLWRAKPKTFIFLCLLEYLYKMLTLSLREYPDNYEYLYFMCLNVYKNFHLNHQ